MSKSNPAEKLAEEYVAKAPRWSTLTGVQRDLVDFEVLQAFLAGYIAALENWNPSNDEQN